MRNSDPRLRITFSQRPDSTDNWSWSPIRVQFLCFPESILLVVMSRQALAKNCSSVSLVTKYCPISTTCINPASIQNLLTLCFLVEAIRYVLDIAAIEDSGVMGCHSPKELLPWIHWEQLIVPSIHQVAPIYLDGFQILHTCLQLLRKDWADWQKKKLCEKKTIVG